MVETAEPQPITLKEYVKNPNKYVMMPGMAKARHIVVEQRMKRLTKDSYDLDINKIEKGNSSIGIITSGVVYHYAKEVLPEASYLKLGMIHPLRILF